MESVHKEIHYKAWSTRKMRSDLHYRLKLLAAKFGVTIEDVLNEVLAAGLDVLEQRDRLVGG